MVLTTSSLFLHTLAQVGIDHVFVNWGSDHPAMLEELERQRATYGDHALKIVTSPNEMVALSAAHGYAQVTGRPAAVIVHVDLGTQVRLPCVISAPLDIMVVSCALFMPGVRRRLLGLFIMQTRVEYLS